MSLPIWTKYDANIYHSLSLFPEKLENTPLSPSEFTNHFKDFYGRPVQDIVEALHHYSQKGYFKFELTLKPEYLNHGQALAKILDKLSGSSAAHDKYHELSKLVYDKFVAGQPLTKDEASALPDKAKSYLAFKLSDLDRGRLSDDLAIYDHHTSKLTISGGKTTTKLPELDIKGISLNSESYDKRTGVLYLARFYRASIAGKSGVKRPDGQKYEQCWVMERLFKSDKTLGKGVPISTLLRMHKDNVDKTTTRKIENAVAEINKKVTDVTHSKNLLMIDDKKVKITPFYL
jgi:hypothetical protein